MIKVLHYLYVGIGTIGVAVITWGVVLVTFRLIRAELGRVKGRRICKEREIFRHQLGSYLLLGLEFMIAADIIGTITHPTIKDIAVLASIVVIRTIISYFLDREMADSYFCRDDAADGPGSQARA
ncbi:MAG: DUF1622 domain-containing protein [Candidatus Aminicenantes bacterium]|nr:DUF1622 domain-containing protein [Candidatus Aminicenantes bacterium]